MEWPSAPQLDPLLAYAWLASSAGLLVFYGSCWIRLRRQSEEWSLQLLEGIPVRVTNELGPAAFGNTRPLIIVPQWLCVSPPSIRAFVLRHELEHLAARDPLLLMCAFVATALMPWNILLWWQLRRLHLAIDIDCDARVLRTSVDVNAYSEMLREVRRRRRHVPLGVVALGEPVPQLKYRIRMLLGSDSHCSRWPALAGMMLAAYCVTVAAHLSVPTINGDVLWASSVSYDVGSSIQWAQQVARARLTDFLEQA